MISGDSRHPAGGEPWFDPARKALYPKRCADLGRPKRLAPEVAEVLIALKTTHPSWSVRQVIAGAIGSGHLPDGVRLAHATVHGLLGAEGLMSKPAAAQPAAGDSMESSLRDGDLVCLDTPRPSPRRASHRDPCRGRPGCQAPASAQIGVGPGQRQPDLRAAPDWSRGPHHRPRRLIRADNRSHIGRCCCTKAVFPVPIGTAALSIKPLPYREQSGVASGPGKVPRDTESVVDLDVLVSEIPRVAARTLDRRASRSCLFQAKGLDGT